MQNLALKVRATIWLVFFYTASLLSAQTTIPELASKANPTLSREITTLIRLLEEVHYNREGVHHSDYAQLIPDYMAELDAPRLFFLESDKADFLQKYPSRWLYDNISSLGKIDPAFSVFSVYRDRVTSRITWIFKELEGEIALNTGDTYLLDRSQGSWPATTEDADKLWRQRLKFDILQEVLNKKSVEDARAAVRKRYERILKNLGEIEPNELSEMFLSTISRMYDPHSTYFSADTFEDFGIQMRLQLVGIGALLSLEEDYCVVKEIITGGPADLGKQLRPNDKIIAVAQTNEEPVDVIGMKLRKIVDLIRGTKGSQVTLTIQPADATDPSARKQITLTRDVVNLDSSRARGAIFEVPSASGKITPIGVISLPAFYGPDASADSDNKNSATGDVRELINRMQKAGIKALVLDLRNNGGGLLSEAIDLTGLFIKQGPVVQIRNYYGDVKSDSDENPSITYTGPLAVLVSKFSASASEIVAGALQNYGRGIIVGDSSTHGKGSVQTVIEMKNVVPAFANAPFKTGAAKLTIQKFYLPDGHSTQRKGVVPDITLPSIEDYLPVGEKDLPHALVWDEIPRANKFDGQPLDARVISPLKEASLARQARLEEFAYLQKNIDWFKTKQEQKTVSLNLDERLKQKEVDTTFRDAMKAEKERLTKNDFTFKEFNLGLVKQTKPKVQPVDKDNTSSEMDTVISNDDEYGKFDIHLREAMRILTDAIDLGAKRDRWASDHPPLTAQVSNGG